MKLVLVGLLFSCVATAFAADIDKIAKNRAALAHFILVTL
jgi:hypothetical protein